MEDHNKQVINNEDILLRDVRSIIESARINAVRSVDFCRV